MVLSSIEQSGSMGASSDPSRTFKNKRMPGHMGSVNTTVIKS